jgi:UDP-glucose:(heptosyl)LPS alpha-1,3-glucosyltransferase
MRNTTPRMNIFIRNLSDKGGGEGVCVRFIEFLQHNDVPVSIFCGRNRLSRHHELTPLIHELGLLGISRLTKYWSMNRKAQGFLDRGGVNFSFDRIDNVDVFRNGGGAHKSFLEKSLCGYSSFRRARKMLVRMLSPFNRYVCRLEERVLLNEKLRSIIVSSEMARDEVAGLHPSIEHKIVVVPNGVDKELFNVRKTASFRKETRQRFALEGKTVVGFASNNFERKGLHHLVDALRFLPEDHVLLVAGRGDIERYMSPETRGRIFYAGRVERMEQDFYPALDLFCFPSLYDPFGFVTAEALCMGVPVLATRQCGSHEIIQEGLNGYTLDSFSPQEIAAKILLSSHLPVSDYSRHVLGMEEMYRSYLAVALGTVDTGMELPLPIEVPVQGEPVRVRP